MPQPDVSVVITTHNRAALVGRAVESALALRRPATEVIVVDDASTDDTRAVLDRYGGRIRVLRQETNGGVCRSRNMGIAAARAPWVLPFDDDDALLPTALDDVAAAIGALDSPERYPVLKFASTNSHQDAAVAVITLDDYLRDRIRGDLIPVIQRDVFLAQGLTYPEQLSPVSGEDLLWWDLAERFGIPVSPAVVVRVIAPEDGVRMGSSRTQVAHAAAHARFQEAMLERFGPTLAERYPEVYVLRRLGAATYRLLLGERRAARAHLRAVGRRGGRRARVLWALSALPTPAVRPLFRAYRRATVGM